MPATPKVPSVLKERRSPLSARSRSSYSASGTESGLSNSVIELDSESEEEAHHVDCHDTGRRPGTAPQVFRNTRAKQRKALPRQARIDLGVIELTDDSDSESVPSVGSVGARRKRGSEACEKDEYDKHLSVGSRHKQRKLTHAGRIRASTTASNVKHEDQDQEHLRMHTATSASKKAEPSEGPSTENSNEIKTEPLPQTFPEKWHQLRDPKAEIKEEYLLKAEDVLPLFSADSLIPYPISLAADKRNVTVTRTQLSTRFGGNAMDTFPRPNAQRIAEHGFANFMCINLMWNPHGPQKPGHGGLFFETTVWPGDAWTSNLQHSPVQVLFVRLGTKKWLYLGEYEMKNATSMPVEQWRELHPRVRALWVTEISRRDWGQPIRARIHLRRTLGREPTRAEVEEARGSFKDIVPQDIQDALDTGRESIQSWSMTCIGYDEQFQLGLIVLPSDCKRSR